MSLEKFYNDFNMLERIKPILTEGNVTIYSKEFVQDSLTLIAREFFELLASSVKHYITCDEMDRIKKATLKGAIISLEQFREIFDDMSDEFKQKVEVRLPKTIQELVEWPVERSTASWFDFQEITNTTMNFFPILEDAIDFDGDAFDIEERFRINYLKDYCFDGRRTYTFAYITLDDEPAMIFYRAGREGMDHYGFWSIGKGWYNIQDALKTYCEFDDKDNGIKEVNMDDEIAEDFTQVYGYNLLSEFKPWSD